jgi:hypothetical protein
MKFAITSKPAIYGAMIVTSLTVMMAFIVYFLNLKDILSLKGAAAFLLYCGLSLITGLRYFNFINAMSGTRPGWSSVFRLPAAMNLAGLIFPVKGGGLWLILYLKKYHDIPVLQGAFLALLNALLAACMVAALLFMWLTGTEFSSSLFVAIFLPTYLICAFACFFLSRKTNRIAAPRAFSVVARDVLLSISFMSVLFLLAAVISSDQPPPVLFGLVVLTITSSVVKVTPGNVGVFEGLALLLKVGFPETGDAFPEFAAVFRLLSLIHACVFGIPSMLSFFSFSRICRLWQNH